MDSHLSSLFWRWWRVCTRAHLFGGLKNSMSAAVCLHEKHFHRFFFAFFYFFCFVCIVVLAMANTFFVSSESISTTFFSLWARWFPTCLINKKVIYLFQRCFDNLSRNLCDGHPVSSDTFFFCSGNADPGLRLRTNILFGSSQPPVLLVKWRLATEGQACVFLNTFLYFVFPLLPQLRLPLLLPCNTLMLWYVTPVLFSSPFSTQPKMSSMVSDMGI